MNGCIFLRLYIQRTDMLNFQSPARFSETQKGREDHIQAACHKQGKCNGDDSQPLPWSSVCGSIGVSGCPPVSTGIFFFSSVGTP
ncbi:hypothetical protein [Bacteroides xylanisolvens]|uniref:hypothetical protein n=1 Tax=Bacteroides xylanisolvens TaxID=371601 RepID=UPI00202544E7|nr:hypothetical protein [Bacteroides xylanisolvens]